MTTVEEKPVKKVDAAGDRAGDVELVPISAIKVDEKINVRSNYDGIEVLAKQIDAQGLLTPLTVDEQYKLIAGFRRYKALTEYVLKGKPDELVKVTVKHVESLGETMLLNIAENTGRENIADYDLAQRLNMLEDENGKFGIKRTMLEKQAGMSKTAVGKFITTWRGICPKVRKAWEASTKGELKDVDGKEITLPTVRVYEMSKKEHKVQEKMLEAFLDHDRAALEPEGENEGEGGGGGGDDETARGPKKKEIKAYIEKLEAKKEKDGEFEAEDMGRWKALRWVIGVISRPA